VQTRRGGINLFRRAANYVDRIRKGAFRNASIDDGKMTLRVLNYLATLRLARRRYP
jgi:hypothetical protein